MSKLKELCEELGIEYGKKTDAGLIDLRGVDLECAKLQGYSISGVDFTGANLKSANLSNVEIFNSIFTKANLELAILNGACIDHTEFDNANLRNVEADEIYCTNTNFVNANLDDTAFGSAHFEYVDFTEAHCKNVYLHEATLINVCFRSAFIEDAVEFVGANLENVSFENIHREGEGSFDFDGASLKDVNGFDFDLNSADSTFYAGTPKSVKSLFDAASVHESTTSESLFKLKLRDLKKLPDSIMLVYRSEAMPGQNDYGACETYKVKDYLDNEICEIRNHGSFHTVYVYYD